MEATSASILILGNMDKPGCREQIEALAPWLGERAEVLGVFSHREAPADLAARATLVLVFGGDGTLLSVARDVAGSAKAILGVNMGKLGFLADFGVKDIRHHLDAILADPKPVSRLMLTVRVWDDDKETTAAPSPAAFCSLAANDIVITAGPPFRMIDLNVSHGETRIARYCGDGLLVSTPTGSTGYNLSSGGPILPPTLRAIILSSLAPHTLSLRPMVLGCEDPIRIVATRVNPGTTILIDGQIAHPLHDGAIIEVSQAPHAFPLIPHPGRPFFQILADKLNWGASPHHT